MPTDTARPQTDALKFALRGVAGSLGVFGLLRLAWIEAHLVVPITLAQGTVAVGLFGTPARPVEATLACSGADAMALCLGAILAYPVKWRMRLAGAAGGAALILGLNIVRIGTLGRVAASPEWFSALHVYVWPAVLTLSIAGYVFAWMRVADRTAADVRAARDVSAATPEVATWRDDVAHWRNGSPWGPSRRFMVCAAVFLLLFAAASPFYLASSAVFTLADFIAHAAAMTLGAIGVSAHAADNVLWTPGGGFLVTQECIATPLIPIYLAGVWTCSPTWRRVILGVVATLPLFVALGVARLLVVALPGTVASPVFFVHAFYQLLLAGVVVFLAALWRHGRRSAPGYAVLGVLVGILFVQLIGPFYARAIAAPAGLPLDDPQGAIALLPAFQVGLYLALSVAAFVAVGWPRFLAGLGAIGFTQIAGLLALNALDFTAHVRDVRGWAVAGPVLIFAAVVNGARPRR